jgi:signal transduction histidine kinase
MQKPAVPPDEKERLAAVRDYHILDTGAETSFDEITQLAAEICQTPISMITLIDSDRQWFKSGFNLPVREIPRNLAFCSHAINHPFDPFVIPDMRADKRYADHPFVTGDPHVVFYTGIPLTNPEGFALGTLCVLDRKPKTLTESQMHSLQILARQVMQLLELRKSNARLESLTENLEARHEDLQQFAYVVSHDIKSPLASIVLAAEMLREGFGEKIDEENDQLLKLLGRASFKIKNLLDGILAYYRSERAMNESPESFRLKPFLLSLQELFKVNKETETIYPQDNPEIFARKTALELILVNLLQNAVKYNDKQNPRVEIAFSQDESNYYFSVKDNGNGLPLEIQQKITEMFGSTASADRFGTQGAGIGLFTVKKIVEKLSGKMELKSKLEEGSEFSFFIKKEN